MLAAIDRVTWESCLTFMPLFTYLQNGDSNNTSYIVRVL